MKLWQAVKQKGAFMFTKMISSDGVIEMIKNSTPIETAEERELREARRELSKLKGLNLDQQIATKLGALKLYMDFFITWKHAQAQNKLTFRWEWGKLKFSCIEVFEREYPHDFCPIMDFEEFSALLIISYTHY